MHYACRAATSFGGRCKDNSPDGKFCGEHAKMERVGSAKKPDIVFFKYKITEEEAARLEAAGVPSRTGDFDRRDQKNIRRAEDQGRNPYEHRGVPDAGTPVFGTDGLNQGPYVLGFVYESINEADYLSTDVYLEPSRKGRGVHLVIRVSCLPDTAPVDVDEEVSEFMFSPWSYIHVWANPPNEDGHVVHTVNCIKPVDTQPKASLVFEGGYWGTQPAE